ncbi:precorrin-6A/cobalt-precorrin-6A reductase [Motiliproteus sp. SC1-56]|uniref:precorrin-6A/cobalt-precorrin-6A reductase n=1 Tax=Motiliproteus sp. SC1-56 TaxID=2799565 RepID=UPI001A90AD08|nr:precorrin-6A/cobalt-precorrin-6A reductase [Motiliproteus sp. SC1-56]
MNILILGGTEEARTLATTLARGAHVPFYRSAGTEQALNGVRCRWGRYPNIKALVDDLRQNQVDLLVDATSPYARAISLRAFEAAEQAGITLWRFQSPLWEQAEGDHWIHTPDWFATLEMSDFQQPIICLEQSAADYLSRIPPGQQWLLWDAGGKQPTGAGYRVEQRPPDASTETALALIDSHGCDVIVTGDLGGPRLSPEVAAARARGLAVIFQTRPLLPESERLFDDINTLLLALDELTAVPS